MQIVPPPNSSAVILQHMRFAGRSSSAWKAGRAAAQRGENGTLFSFLLVTVELPDSSVPMGRIVVRVNAITARILFSDAGRSSACLTEFHR